MHRRRMWQSWPAMRLGDSATVRGGGIGIGAPDVHKGGSLAMRSLSLGRTLAGLAVAALGLAGALPAAADIFATRTNADLLKYCRSTVETFDAVAKGRDVVPKDVNGSWDLATAMAGCQGFLEGFRDAMDQSTRSTTAVGLFHLVCLPDTVNTANLAAVYVQWGNAHPDKGSESASMGVYRAWREAWPCSVTTSQ